MRGERQRKRQTKRDGVREIFKKKEKDRKNEGESKRKRKKTILEKKLMQTTFDLPPVMVFF